jgi:hypothetical protein
LGAEIVIGLYFFVLVLFIIYQIGNEINFRRWLEVSDKQIKEMSNHPTLAEIEHRREIELERFRHAFEVLKARRGNISYDNADDLLEDVIRDANAYIVK